MKKVVVLIISIGILFLGSTVFAKDVIYSLNKYQNEQLDYVLKDSTGFVMAGTYEKEKHNTQVVLLKYKKNGQLEWKYSYGENQEDQLYGLSYLYDGSHSVMGYVLLVEETTGEARETSPHFLLIDLEGKLIREQETRLSSDAMIHKIEIIENDENIDGYLVVGSQNHMGFIAKYSRDLNMVWKEELNIVESKIIDVVAVQPNHYYVVVSKIVGDQTSYVLMQYDEFSHLFTTLKEDFENNLEPHLEKDNQSYLVYGITNDVKLSNNQVGSYYLMKYNLSNEEEWETIGNTSVDEDGILKVQAIQLDNQIIEYYILSTNRKDHSIEVMRADHDGVLQEKVKKLKNNYYDIHNFLFDKDTLYFVGQISCPEDDNCDYNEKSLFLVCTEDKVIEVKDHDSGYILVGILVIAIMIGLIYVLRRKKQLKKTTKTKKHKKTT